MIVVLFLFFFGTVKLGSLVWDSEVEQRKFWVCRYYLHDPRTHWSYRFLLSFFTGWICVSHPRTCSTGGDNWKDLNCFLTPLPAVFVRYILARDEIWPLQFRGIMLHCWHLIGLGLTRFLLHSEEIDTLKQGLNALLCQKKWSHFSGMPERFYRLLRNEGKFKLVVIRSLPSNGLRVRMH